MLLSSDSLAQARDAGMRERGAHPYALQCDPAPITVLPCQVSPCQGSHQQVGQRQQDERAVDATLALIGLPLAKHLHTTHVLSLLGRVAYCRHCGYTASAISGLTKTGLASQCRGEPPNTGAASRLRRMLDGKDPKTGERLESRAVPVPKLLLWRTALQRQRHCA